MTTEAAHMGYFRKISFGQETYGVMCYGPDMRPGQCYAGSLADQASNVKALLEMGYMPAEFPSESNKVKPEEGCHPR